MDAGNPLARGVPVIEANLGTNGGEVSFYSLEQADRWINQEIECWEHALIYPKHSLIDSFLSGELKIIDRLQIVERQLHLPRRIKEYIDNFQSLAHDEHHAIFEKIIELFKHYADYRSLCSKSESGRTISRILSLHDERNYFIGMGGLIGMLRVPLADIIEDIRIKVSSFPNTGEQILLGYTTWRTLDFLEKPDILEQMERFDAVIDRSEGTFENIRKKGAQINKKAGAELEDCRSNWNKFLEAAKKERKGLEEAFEEHMRLHAPATYWRERAASASKTAKRALAAFLGGALAVVGSSIVFGPWLLERLAAVEGAGSFAPLALVSIPALTALWGLRHAARLFVANLERSADARMRETMATTFLALTKEQGDIEKEERLLVLQALFRPPTTARTDDGHFGGALEILTRRNPPA